jgi:hypothetical protein
MGSPINQKVEKLLELLFSDKLISGLQVVQTASWISHGASTFNALTGEVTDEGGGEEEIKMVLLPFQGGFQEPMGIGSSLPGSQETLATATAELKFVMLPLEKEANQGLKDQLRFNEKVYQIMRVQPIWLGNKTVLWEVIAQ